jgi:hypothetical protein
MSLLNRMSEKEMFWCGREDSNPTGILSLLKLFIPRSDKIDKSYRSAEVRYTAGTRSLHRFHACACAVVEVHHAVQ